MRARSGRSWGHTEPPTTGAAAAGGTGWHVRGARQALNARPPARLAHSTAPPTTVMPMPMLKPWTARSTAPGSPHLAQGEGVGGHRHAQQVAQQEVRGLVAQHALAVVREHLTAGSARGAARWRGLAGWPAEWRIALVLPSKPGITTAAALCATMRCCAAVESCRNQGTSHRPPMPAHLRKLVNGELRRGRGRDRKGQVAV